MNYSAWEIITEAALGGAEAHVGPSNISTKDYEQKVQVALCELKEQLETYEKTLRWIERFAYRNRYYHTGFTHIQRRAMFATKRTGRNP